MDELKESTSADDARLGICEVCAKNDAKYCCPRCEVKTCCLPCLKIHKKELDCSGIRDRVKYRSMSALSDMDLLSDYRMLEEIGRAVENYSKFSFLQRSGPYDLPKHLICLRAAASRRNVQLHFLPRNFSRRQNNTTFLDFSTQELFWRIEWVFPQADSLKFTDSRVLDSTRLCNAVDQYLNPLKTTDKMLQFYQAAGHNGVVLLLKAERIPGDRYIELDSTLSVRDNLAGKIILEYPVIHVLMKDHKETYDILSPDEETKISEQIKTDTLNRNSNRFQRNHRQKQNQFNGRNHKAGSKNYLFPEEDTCTNSRISNEKRHDGLQIPDYNEL